MRGNNKRVSTAARRPPFFLSDDDSLLRREWQRAWPAMRVRGMMPFHGVPLLEDDAGPRLDEAVAPVLAKQLVLF